MYSRSRRWWPRPGRPRWLVSPVPGALPRLARCGPGSQQHRSPAARCLGPVARSARAVPVDDRPGVWHASWAPSPGRAATWSRSIISATAPTFPRVGTGASAGRVRDGGAGRARRRARSRGAGSSHRRRAHTPGVQEPCTTSRGPVNIGLTSVEALMRRSGDGPNQLPAPKWRPAAVHRSSTRPSSRSCCGWRPSSPTSPTCSS